MGVVVVVRVRDRRSGESAEGVFFLAVFCLFPWFQILLLFSFSMDESLCTIDTFLSLSQFFWLFK